MIGGWLRFARRVLRLPEGNPPLPAGSRESVQVWNPGRGYLAYRMLGLVAGLPFTVLFLAGTAWGALLLARNEGLEPWNRLAWPAWGVLAFWSIAGTAWQAACLRLELDMLRYTLTDRAVRLRRGVRQLREITISFANVQNVRYEQGPLQRAFGIADLVIDVAGGGGGAAAQGQEAARNPNEGRLVGIGEPEKLREIVLERVRRVRGSGLGDEDEDDAGPRHGVSLGSPDVVQLLAGMRDDLAAASARLEGRSPS